MQAVLNRLPELSFRVGYPAALFIAAYWSVVALVARLIFGEHSLAQAGIEALALGAVMTATYCFGYYAERLFIARKYIRTFAGDFLVISSARKWFFMILAAALTIVGARYVHAIIPAAFTSYFFLAIYAGVAGWMVHIGLDDRKVQNWNDDGIA